MDYIHLNSLSTISPSAYQNYFQKSIINVSSNKISCCENYHLNDDHMKN